jgi:predicted nucleic acid-binding protein
MDMFWGSLAVRLHDAAYIALAEALGCELLTGDVKLKNAAGHYATVIVTR